jgi:hypothetical protein
MSELVAIYGDLDTAKANIGNYLSFMLIYLQIFNILKTFV